MKLRLHTDFALRTLMYLAFVGRRASVEDISAAFAISKDHLVKVVQELARLGFVRTIAGRSGGVELARDSRKISVRQVIEQLEGRNGVLDCVPQPEVCPLEPGCRLRRMLISAEAAFYDSFGETTIHDVVHGQRKGGLNNLDLVK